MKTILVIVMLLCGGVCMAQTRTILLDTQEGEGECAIFKRSQEVGLSYVLHLNPDRLLAPCYEALGQKNAARPYGGWESMQIKGHTLGHYLSALSQFVYATDNKEALDRLVYTVGQIKKLQRQDGYFGGIPSTPFDKAFTGTFDVDRFSLAGWWVPWYSVHKIYAGLIDAYTLAGNEEALQVVRGMADWAVRASGKMTEEQFQRMLYCEHGGMCKVFADLYGITHEDKYLAMAQRFIHQEVVKPAMKGVDKLQGYHANTQMPKFLGLARLYETEHKEEYKKAVEFFFNTVAYNRSYALGGNSLGEHFGQQLQETLGRDTCETCNTYNMLELAEHVFAWTHDAAVADFYETALYNHILASQDPDSGAKTYFVSTLPGFFKVYCSDENAFWCCTGTGLENPARYGRFIVTDDGDALRVNLFISAVATTADGWQIKINTAFPYGASAKVEVLQRGKGTRKLLVRRSAWASGSGASTSKSEYQMLSSSPNAGDVFDVPLPMEVHTRRTRDGSGNFSVFYGPLLLAADLGKQGIPRDKVDNQLVYMNEAAIPVAHITANPLSSAQWVHGEGSVLPGSGACTLRFVTDRGASSDGTVYHLRPFFDVHHTRYTVYFNDGRGKSDAREQKWAAVTLDKVTPGRQQSEVEHHIKCENAEMGYIDTVDRNFRAIGASSALSYRIRTSASGGKIIVTIYGKDRGTLRVIIDGKEAGAIVQNAGDDALADYEIDLSGGDGAARPIKADEGGAPAAQGKTAAQSAQGIPAAANVSGKSKVRTMSFVCDTGSVHLLELRSVM